MSVTRWLQVNFSLLLHGLYVDTYTANITMPGNGSKFETTNKIPPYSILFHSNLCPLRDLFCFVFGLSLDK